MNNESFFENTTLLNNISKLILQDYIDFIAYKIVSTY